MTTYFKKVNSSWQRVVSRSTSNFNVLTVDGKEVGFVYKPKDNRSDRNAWRVHLGLGNDTRFMGHTWNLRDAKRLLESIAVGGVRGLNS